MNGSRKTIRPNKWCCDDDGESSIDNLLNSQYVRITEPTSPFGELTTADLNPSIQIDFIDSLIHSSKLKTFIIGASSGAAISTLDNECTVTAGTGADNYSFLVSRRVVSYQPGQGTMARFTARFSSPQTNSNQFAGLYNSVSGYRFGYVGNTFGIHYRRDGTREIRALTITTGSSTVGGYATVTLNGETKQILINSGSSTTKTAYELSKTEFYDVGDGWLTSVTGNIVYFVSAKPKPYSGSFSFSHATAVGTFSTITVGELPNEEFIEQSSWNIDIMNGSGASGLTLDPTKANVYSIGFQYLGYGNALFQIESPVNGRFVPVHMIKNTGLTNYPVIRNPYFFMTWSSENTGVVATPTTVYGASAAGFIAGVKKYLSQKFSYSTVKDYGSTGLIPIFTIRTNRVFNNLPSVIPIRLDRISIGSDVVKPVEILAYSGGSLNTANFTQYSAGNSRAEIDTTATSIDITNARLVSAISMGRSTQFALDVRDDDFDIQVGEEITFCISSHQTSANQFISISISWSEG